MSRRMFFPLSTPDMQYGQLALDSEKEKKAFQKLIFLVRDWNNPGEFPYGSKGGKKFLQEKLRIKEDQPKEAKSVRDAIRNCFEDLDCFLMPNIGDKALYPAFTGSVGELDSKFAKNMEQFIVSLVSNEEMVIKEVFNEVVSAQGLREILEGYLDIFNSEEMPSATTFLEASHEYHNGAMLKKAMTKFVESVKKTMRGKSYLPDKEMERALKNGEKSAMDPFNKARKFGTKEKIEEWKERLEENLKIEKTNLKKVNEESRRKYIEGAREEAIQKCRDILDEEFSFDDGEFYEEKAIIRSISQATGEAIEEFKEKLEKETEEELQQNVSSLEATLEEAASKYVDKNKVYRAEAEKIMLCLIETLKERFQSEATELQESNKYLEVGELLPKWEVIMMMASEDYKKFKKPGKNDFQKEYQEKLVKELQLLIGNLENSHKLQLQEMQMKADKAIESACKEYEKELKDALISAEIEEEVDEAHAEKSIEVLKAFKDDQNPYPDGEALHDSVMEKLSSELSQICEKVKMEVVLNRQRVIESYRNAMDQAVNYYVEEMQGVLSSCDFLSDEDLEKEHQLAVEGALEEYENTEKVGVPDNALNLKAEMAEKLSEKYETIIGENNTNRELAISKAKNLVHECHSEYQDILKAAMEKVRDEAELEDQHHKATKQVVKMLQDRIPAKEDPQFVDEFLKELNEEIEDTWEELKDIFEMERTKDETNLKGLLVECRRYYSDEMQTHIQNATFIRPNVLEQLHEDAKKVALDRCKASTPVSTFQEARLEEELEGAFKKVQEKNHMKLNALHGVEPAIGIDLGTTYCCVAVFFNGQVQYIPNTEQGNAETTPSYVQFKSDGSRTFGYSAKETAYEDPENTIYDAKRIIGRKMNDEKLQADMKYWPFEVVEHEGIPKIKANGRLCFPEEVGAELLGRFRLMAEKFLGMEVKKAVITVPAYFKEGQRIATKDAGEIAGLEVLTILNEPTAAAIAYSLDRLDNTARKVLIFDLGGGTFDVAIVEMAPKEIKVLVVGGDTHFGGEDFDKNMMEHCALKFMAEEGVDLLADKDSSDATARYDARRRLRRLQTKCEEAKKALSSGRTATVAVDAMYDGVDLNVEITRDEFEKINATLFQKTITIVEKALNDAGIRKEQIEDIVLVGGSTRIPKVQEMLKDFFGGRALNHSIHPDKAVAHGAAVQAALMNGEQAKDQIDFNSIQDVTPQHIGVEVDTKELSVIIQKNTKIPQKCKGDYSTASDNQTTCCIKVYQGEDLNLAANNDLLGEFKLDGIPPGPKGKEMIDVFMELDSMGILHVEAVSRSTKSKNKITVTANKQRMSSETKKMLLAASTDPAA